MALQKGRPGARKVKGACLSIHLTIVARIVKKISLHLGTQIGDP